MPQTPGVPDHAVPSYDVVEPGAVEPKVAAATGGAGVGGALALFLMWGLDELFWNGDAPPDVPGPVAGLIWVVVPSAVAFVGGYLARHVNRVR